MFVRAAEMVRRPGLFRAENDPDGCRSFAAVEWHDSDRLLSYAERLTDGVPMRWRAFTYYDGRETWTSPGSATSDRTTLGKIGREVRRSGNRFNTAMVTAPPVRIHVMPCSPRVPSS